MQPRIVRRHQSDSKAIVNCWDLAAGKEARERLALRFWATQKIVPRRPRRRLPAPGDAA
jgi:hypothetical protein